MNEPPPYENEGSVIVGRIDFFDISVNLDLNDAI